MGCRGLSLATSVACLLVVSLLPPVTPSTRAASGIRWGYYVTYAPSSIATLRAQVDQFTHISPWYFSLRADGTLASTEQPATTALIRSRNVKVVPMVQNIARYDEFRAMVDTPEKMGAVVETVAGIALRPEYDGVHVDFEGLNADDRDLLTEFMRRLAERVRPAGKLVTQAVAARTREVRTGWGGAYDYEQLGKHNDLIVVMAYDFNFAGGEPGPVAPLDWVRRVGAYAAVSFGPSSTILGAPLYGYDWAINKTPRERARSVSYAGAQELLERHGGERGYDEVSHSEWGRYRVGDEERQIWFESARSLKAKLEIMQAQGLAGVALWRLGQEDPAVWPMLKEIGNPANPAPPVAPARDVTYFSETRHTLRGPFLRYWREQGGLARFGYPLTEEFTEANAEDGRVRTVQYFERARFEYHIDLAGTPNEVQLGHLGRWALQVRGLEASPPEPPAADSRYFPETGLNLRAGFRAYWEANGGLATFGLPLTGEFDERNAEDGRVYTVQYFERGRFEWHPEHRGTGYEIQLGHLGRQVLRAREWIA